jgi:hypothetical protein
MKLISREKMAPKFKYTEQKETFMPDLSGQSGRRYILTYAKHLNKRIYS